MEVLVWRWFPVYIGEQTKKYRMTEKDGSVYDPIRRKYVNKTPEEEVRQRVIKFLIREIKVPKNKLIVERGLNTLGVKKSRKRIDIGILDADDQLMAVIECKDALLYQATVYEQAQDYISKLGVGRFFVADGNHLEGYYWNGMQFVLIEDAIPEYKDWKALLPVGRLLGNE